MSYSFEEHAELRKMTARGMQECWDCGLEDRTAIVEIVDETCSLTSKKRVASAPVTVEIRVLTSLRGHKMEYWQLLR